MDEAISGAISGALNPESKPAVKHVEQYYEAVRHRQGDAAKIAQNTGISEKKIAEDIKRLSASTKT